MTANACLQLLIIAVTLSGLEGNTRASTPVSAHDENTLYRQLREGVESRSVPALPAPSLKDGLDAVQQRAVLASLPGLRVRLSDFLRNSPVSPIHLVIGHEPASNQGKRIRSLNLWFVAFGGLNDMASGDKTFDLFPKDERGQVQLTPEQLLKRGIDPPPPGVTYSHANFSILDRVQLKETLRVQRTSTSDSVIIAGTIDSRFNTDPEFPNSWHPVSNGPGAVRKIGPSSPYSVQAFYLKATRLLDPVGAILVEYHVQFEYPLGWFDGKDLLTSKLPIVVETGVRTFRRRLLKPK